MYAKLYFNDGKGNSDFNLRKNNCFHIKRDSIKSTHCNNCGTDTEDIEKVTVSVYIEYYTVERTHKYECKCGTTVSVLTVERL